MGGVYHSLSGSNRHLASQRRQNPGEGTHCIFKEEPQREVTRSACQQAFLSSPQLKTQTALFLVSLK